MLGFFGPFYDQLVGMLRKQQGQLAFDRIDQLNAWFTPVVMVGLTFAISCKQYFGHPLKCWTPREFSGSWDGYVHDFCFIENTYFVPNGTEITDEARAGRHINYYRWVPLVLMIQAAMFVIPYSIWNISHKRTDINLKTSLRLFEKLLGKLKVPEACEAFSIEIWHKLSNIRKSSDCLAGSRATIFYFLLKLGFIVNCLFQMILLKHFLGLDDYFWGFSHIWNVDFKGTSEREDSIFPRVVLCDFKVRNLGQQHQHTVPCIMIMNMIIEKLYTLFYFWLIFVFVVTAVAMLHFGFQLLFRRHSLIPTNLNNKPSMNPTRAHRFLKEVLKLDGVLLLTYFDSQFGAFRTSQIVDRLVEKFVVELRSEYSRSTSLHDEQTTPERYVAFNSDTIPMNELKSDFLSDHKFIEEVDGPSAPPAIEEKKSL